MEALARILLFVTILLVSTFVCQSNEVDSREEKEHKEYFYTISTTWNGEILPEGQKVNVSLEGVPDSRDIIFRIDSPYYDDPAPDGEPGQPFMGLWDYEVVEIFFLNENDQYLEVEVSPHGQHILLLLNGERNTIRHSLPMEVTTSIVGSRWSGEATIPGDYFPPQVTKLNAYAIHGLGESRKYLALYPTDGSTKAPDFHNLSFFQPIHADLFLNQSSELSPIWQDALQGVFKYKITRQWNTFRTSIPPTSVTLQGFEGGVEINFTMPLNSQEYPAESFVIIFENAAKEAVKIQLFVDGNNFVEFFKDRREKLSQQKLPLDYRVDERYGKFLKGSALIPPSYFPPNVTLMNMYSLFGAETMIAMTLRSMEIRNDADFRPNLSNLKHFVPIDFDLLVQQNLDYSNLWRKMLGLPLPDNYKDEFVEVTSIKPLEENKDLEHEKESQTVPEGSTGEESKPSVTEVKPKERTDSEDSASELVTQISEQESPEKSNVDTQNEVEMVTDDPVTRVEDEDKVDKIDETVVQSSTSKADDSDIANITEEPEQRVTQTVADVTTADVTARTVTETVTISSTGRTSTTPGLRIEPEENQKQETKTRTPNEENATTESTLEVSTIMNEDLTIPTENEKFERRNQPHFNKPLRFLLKRPRRPRPAATQGRVDLPHTEGEEPSPTPAEGGETLPLIVREEHQRRYEESRDQQNELPITFKITFKSDDNFGGVQGVPQIPTDEGGEGGVAAEDDVPVDDIPLDVIDVTGVFPPPHPICFTEGLVPDYFRCQIFYECVLDNGRWEVFSWRCKRGSYYDPDRVACVRGYC